MENRTEYLEYSLKIESTLSKFLAKLLGVSAYTKSLSFGTKSTALSFNAKVNLLLDLSYLPADTKTKFQKFMEIRNKFMHLIEADTYENCIMLADTEKWIVDTYKPDTSKTKEEQLRHCAIALGREVLNESLKIAEHIFDKQIDENNKEFNQILANWFFNSFNPLVDKYKESESIPMNEILLQWNDILDKLSDIRSNG